MVIGRLVEGNAKKLKKSLATCDKSGNVWVGLKRVGKAEPVLPENTEEETYPPPKEVTLADLDGLYVDSSGDIYDKNSTIVGKLIKGDAVKLAAANATCDDLGNVWNGFKKVGKCEAVQLVKPEEVPEEEAPPPPPPPAEVEKPILTLTDLDGRSIDPSGNIFDDNNNVIGKLVDGNAKKLAKAYATCDDNGVVWNGLKQAGRVELVQPEKPVVEEETPPPPPPLVEADPLCEDSWPEDARLSISENSLCPIRAQHILGDNWKNCNKCYAMIRQVSIQLAHEEGGADKERVDGILLG